MVLVGHRNRYRTINHNTVSMRCIFGAINNDTSWNSDIAYISFHIWSYDSSLCFCTQRASVWKDTRCSRGYKWKRKWQSMLFCISWFSLVSCKPTSYMHVGLITDKLEARATSYYSYSTSSQSTHYWDISTIDLAYNCSIWYMDRSSIATHSSCKSPYT